MTIALILWLAGAAQLIAAFAFFRRPGVRFWVMAPIWKASRYLFPAGVALWTSSLAFMSAGMVAMLVAFAP